MNVSSLGLSLIERYEGFSPTPYICPAGKLTIGFGHVVTKGEHFDSIDQETGKALLEADLKVACASIRRNIIVALSQGQFDALTSFAFNLGGGALQRSTLRQKVNREDYEGAAHEFKKWVYAAGRKLPGLVKRRAEESELFMR